MKSAESSKAQYHKDADKARIISAESSKAQYHKDVDKSCADTSKRVKEHYHKDLDKSRADTSERVKEHYHKDLTNLVLNRLKPQGTIMTKMWLSLELTVNLQPANITW